MADRKQFVNAAPLVDKELESLLSEARTRVISDDDLREQRISFAFGNALRFDKVTKESVRHASARVRVRE